MIHELKCEKKFFEPLILGEKTFELRRNDRGFKIGDTLILKEIENMEYTGNSITCRITYILEKYYGLESNFCIMSLGALI